MAVIDSAIPRPSAYDCANIAAICGGHGDWFSAVLYRLICKADHQRKHRLRLAFPHHVSLIEHWRGCLACGEHIACDEALAFAGQP